MTDNSETLKARQAAWEEKARNIDDYQYKHRRSWQTQKAITYAKIWMWFLRICCVGTIILLLAGLFWETIWLYLLLPPIICITYLIFYQAVIVFEYPKNIPQERKKEYFRFPFFSQAFLLIIGVGRGFTSMKMEYAAAFVFWLVLFVMLAGGVWKITQTPYGHHECSVFAVFFLALYCWMGVYWWNWIATVQEPVHTEAVVLSKEEYSYRASTCYCFNVETMDGNKKEITARPWLYNQTKPGDKVWVCERESVFGVRYSTVHLSECSLDF